MSENESSFGTTKKFSKQAVHLVPTVLVPVTIVSIKNVSSISETTAIS